MGWGREREMHMRLCRREHLNTNDRLRWKYFVIFPSGINKALQSIITKHEYLNEKNMNAQMFLELSEHGTVVLGLRV